MQLEISVGAFERADALPDLLVLMKSFIDGLHDWVAAPDAIATATAYMSEHAPKLAETYMDLARKGTVAAAWTAQLPVSVIRIEAQDLADHVLDLCKQPAVVVVEDLTADGAFLRAICSVFQCRRLQEALSNHWLEIEHGGGSGVRRVAEHVAGRYRRRVRVVALMDSDRMFPGQETHKYVEAAQLMACGVAAHVLALREAENYVPNRVLGMVGNPSDSSHKLTLLARLTPEQRGYFDMKHGFGNPDRPPRIRNEQRALFAGLDNDILLGLRGGFGDRLLTLMESVSGSLREGDFSSLSTSVTAELRALIDKIIEVI